LHAIIASASSLVLSKKLLLQQQQQQQQQWRRECRGPLLTRRCILVDEMWMEIQYPTTAWSIWGSQMRCFIIRDVGNRDLFQGPRVSWYRRHWYLRSSNEVFHYSGRR
jgi:hypothetical protein